MALHIPEHLEKRVVRCNDSAGVYKTVKAVKIRVDAAQVARLSSTWVRVHSSLSCLRSWLDDGSTISARQRRRLGLQLEFGIGWICRAFLSGCWIWGCGIIALNDQCQRLPKQESRGERFAVHTRFDCLAVSRNFIPENPVNSRYANR